MFSTESFTLEGVADGSATGADRAAAGGCGVGLVIQESTAETAIKVNTDTRTLAKVTSRTMNVTIEERFTNAVTPR